MTPQRGPHYAKNCPFHIKPNQPLSAAGVGGTVRRPRLRPAKAVEAGSAPLAYLTILENSPKYDPKHKSGASLGTFIRARVCAKLWNERDKALKAIPYSVLEGDKGDPAPESQSVDGWACCRGTAARWC